MCLPTAGLCYAQPLNNGIFWDKPFLSRLYEIYLPIKDLEILAEFGFYRNFFIYVHNNPFVPQTSDLLEELLLIFPYKFHRNHILLKLKIKKLLPKINVKT